jgi:hypothetical protein
MTLTALYLLAAIVSPLSSHAGGLYRLAMHYACIRLGMSAPTNAHRSRKAECILSQVPSMRQVLK